MEFIALFLLVPLIWSSTPQDTLPADVNLATAPRIEAVDGQLVVLPPEDPALSMTVVELHASEIRGPASIAAGSRRIDVIVSAP